MFLVPSNLADASQQFAQLPMWAQLAMTLTPVIIGAVAAKKGSNKRKARVSDVPPSVAQQKRATARKE